MTRFLLPLLAFLLAPSVGLWAQTPGDIVAEVAEELDEDGRLDDAAVEGLAEMRALAATPLDINAATESDLGKLLFLNDVKIHALLAHRRAVGRFHSPQELMTVRSLSRSDVLRLSHFVSFADSSDNAPSPSALKLEAVARVGRRWPLSRGFVAAGGDKAPFAGGPLKRLCRLRASVGRQWGLGIVGEGDAGEPSFFDFGGGYARLAPSRGPLRSLVIGNYNVRLGQGLGVWTGFGLAQPLTGCSAGRVATGVSPTLSAAEGGQLRGLAAEMRWLPLRLTAYGSASRADATTYLASDGAARISTIRTDGLHRTEAERARRRNTLILQGGVHVSADMGSLRLGAGVNTWRADKPLGPNGRLYLTNRPSVKAIGTYSLDARAFIGRAHVYAEAASQGRHAWGGVAGVDVDAGSGTSFFASVRRFGRRYYAVAQQPVSRSPAAGGEGGGSLGVAFCPLDGVSVMADVDVWRLRWLQYSALAPSTGWRGRAAMSFAPRSSAVREVSLRLRHVSKGVTVAGLATSSDTAYDRLPLSALRAEEKSASLLSAVVVECGGALRLKTNVEHTFANEARGGRAYGFMAGQDVRLGMAGGMAALSVNCSYFNADSHSARVHVSRPGVLYDMGFASYSGRGLTFTGMASLGPWRGFRLWLWLSSVRRFDCSSIGSGNDLTLAPWRTDAKVQLQWKLFWRKRKDFFASQGA